jgi:hypothetical protein
MMLLVTLLLFQTTAAQNATYRPDGRCGSDFDNAPCDPSLSKGCCSING